MRGRSAPRPRQERAPPAHLRHGKRGRARRVSLGLAAALCVLGLATAAVAGRTTHHRLPAEPPPPDAVADEPTAGGRPGPAGPRGEVTLAFAGDTHFQLNLAALLDHPRGALGPISKVLAGADLAMVNLESAIADESRTRAAKELEAASRRFYFRTTPAALDVLAAAGVDVVTMANNHGADYGEAGVQDSLRAIGRSPVHVVGVGANRQVAFTPYLVSVRGTDFAFLGADASKREGSSGVWAAGPTTPGLAAAHADPPRALLDAVRAAGARADVVVVYLHWGEEFHSCPSRRQLVTADALAAAGADIVVGSHAHVLLGSGWLGDTYVNYGLGNFLWYHDRRPVTGVLRLTVRDGHVAEDSFVPARIRSDGRPAPLTGHQARTSVADWRGLRECTGLAPRPATLPGTSSAARSPTPAYSAAIRGIGPRLGDRMRHSHHPGCPVALADLRYLRMTYLGFDGAAHIGELVVHEKYADDVVDVFHRLYDARWPIRRMRLVDDYRGDDDRSMAANNTTGYNCRRVAGQETLSAHAYGAAIDLNPVQNPYVIGTSPHPPASKRFATLDRSADSHVPMGAIRSDDVVVRAFSRIGWSWGGDWATAKDYQHFTSSTR